MNKRIEALDYLRGVMALSVMLYHYTSWTKGGLGAESLLGKLGIYAVSIFYILSGLSLAIGYSKKLDTPNAVISFSIKRIFRIFPLFWVVVTLAIVFEMIQSHLTGTVFEYSPYRIFLNYTLLFGFIEPTAYLSGGAWSIGNEMVFYAFFPLIIYFSIRSRVAFPIFMLVSCLAGLYFSNYVLTDTKTVGDQWHYYINPFNQLFLFVAGIGIALYSHKSQNLSKVFLYVLATISVIAFIFWPISGERAQIITGAERWLFSGLSFLLVFSIYHLDLIFVKPVHKVFEFFGQASYSIYLLHPLVAFPFKFIFERLGWPEAYAYVVAAFATIFAGWVSYNFIEKPMMQKGRQIAQKFKKNKEPTPEAL